MDEPIPVSLAIRAVERAIRDCDAATPGPWDADSPSDAPEEVLSGVSWIASDGTEAQHRWAVSSNARFAVLARAGFRASLEYLRDDLTAMEGEMALPHHRAAVAPLIAHYDATAPGWRTE